MKQSEEDTCDDAYRAGVRMCIEALRARLHGDPDETTAGLEEAIDVLQTLLEGSQ